mmetsp:Transcript_18343/g.33259  ORF Transcript_18343/g.33259 Transcript_18343/m.33259 type:complete len:483 (-) Transcript_18343:126-1574(-)
MDAVQAPVSSASSTVTATSSDGRGSGSGGTDFLNLVGNSSSISGVGMFGQPGGSGDLFLGSGGFDGPIGNGYGNEGSGSGRTTPGTDSSTFDLSDFPSLGGSSGVQVGGGSANNGLAAALRQQQQLMAHQQMMQQGASSSNLKTSNLYRLAMSSGSNGAGSNFSMTTEDFPALPGAPSPSGAGNIGSGSGLLGGEGQREGSSSGGGAGAVSSFGSGQGGTRSSSNGGGLGMYGSELEGGSNQLDVANLLGVGGLGNLGGLQPGSNPGSSSLSQQQRGASSSSAQPPTGAPGSASAGSGGGSALSGDYGLLGLLGVIRMSDADRNALALGSDLTSLGLNLNSSDQLYSTFAGPWSENPTTREPQYQLPMCYYMQPPALKTGHLSKFALETLFYIFYALPKDVLQAYAAQELYSREWRYHVDLKLWFKRAGPNDGVGNNGGAGNQFLFFDINTWERRIFNGNMNQNITSGLMSEEDVRVKFPNS